MGGSFTLGWTRGALCSPCLSMAMLVLTLFTTRMALPGRSLNLVANWEPEATSHHPCWKWRKETLMGLDGAGLGTLVSVSVS